MTSKEIRVRFAPSPTGPQHIGGIRTALYNYLFAKKHGGTFILRIEDTDQTRYVPGAEQYIIDALQWCGLSFDEGPGVNGENGPYRQSERKEIYGQYVEQLINAGYAYYAFDTPRELEEMRRKLKALKSSVLHYGSNNRDSMQNSLTLAKNEVQSRLESGVPYVVRIKIPENENVKVVDLIRGEVSVHSSELDDKVLFKSDGMPTYHLANVVDDHLMRISHVIRGEEWLPSLPLHSLLYKFLGWEKEMPEFAHLPLLLKPDGNGKLSKRDGDRLGFPVFPLEWKDKEEVYTGYREQGFFPEAMINILAFLGWNPGTEKEIFNINELIEVFSLERVGKAGAKFDPEKAKWYNQQYLKAKSNTKLAELLQPLLKEQNIEADDDFVENVCGLMKERVEFVSEMPESIYFFKAPEEYNEKLLRKKWKAETPALMRELKEMLEGIDNFNPVELEDKFKKFLEERDLGFGAVMPGLRLLITGGGSGPSVFEIASLIGKEETLRRVETGLERLR